MGLLILSPPHILTTNLYPSYRQSKHLQEESKKPHIGHLLFLYYGVFTMVPRNNVSIQNEDMSGLVVDIIMSHKMSITSTTISLNAEVASWNKSNKSISSSMVLESNVGEDGLSAQSTYGVNIENKNEIKLLLPHAETFGNEVYLEKKTLVWNLHVHWMMCMFRYLQTPTFLLCGRAGLLIP